MKKRFLMALSLSLVLVLSLVGIAYAAPVYPSTNPGFESGDLTGWTAEVPGDGNITVETSHGALNPQDGSYFALLEPGEGDVTGNLSQSMTVSAGDTILGWAFFDDEDSVGDWGEVVILDNMDALVAQVFYADDAGGDTGWVAWSHTFASAGTYTVEARVTNYGDSMYDSYLGFDLHLDFMPTVSTSLTDGPASVDVGTVATWNATVTICPNEYDDSDDVIVQGGIGSDLVVTEVYDGTTTWYPTPPGGAGWVKDPGKKWRYTYACGSDITLRTNVKNSKASATIVTWDVGDLTGGDSCQSIVIRFQTTLNPKDKQEFTSPDEHHELDGGFSATFWYMDVEFETPETDPLWVEVTEP